MTRAAPPGGRRKRIVERDGRIAVGRALVVACTPRGGRRVSARRPLSARQALGADGLRLPLGAGRALALPALGFGALGALLGFFATGALGCGGSLGPRCLGGRCGSLGGALRGPVGAAFRALVGGGLVRAFAAGALALAAPPLASSIERLLVLDPRPFADALAQLLDRQLRFVAPLAGRTTARRAALALARGVGGRTGFGAAATGAPRPLEHRKAVAHRDAARLAHAHAVRGLERHRFYPTRERDQLEQQIGVGGPRVAHAHRRRSRLPHQIAERGNADQAHGGRDIAHAVDAYERTHRPVGRLEQAADRHRRVGHHQALADHEVGAAFEAASKLGDESRRVGEVTLHEQHRVTTRVARLRRHVPDEGVEGTGITDTGGAAEHRDGHRVGVLFRHVGRLVGARVIVHDDLVLTRELREHGTKPPEKDADGGDLVVRGNGEVEHRSR